jgi:hypothetical protein
METNLDLVERLTRHAESLSWVARYAYLHDRGWGTSEHVWISPHDGSRHSDSVIPMTMEMVLEMEGRPTARSGKYIDIERGEMAVRSSKTVPELLDGAN